MIFLHRVQVRVYRYVRRGVSSAEVVNHPRRKIDRPQRKVVLPHARIFNRVGYSVVKYRAHHVLDTQEIYHRPNEYVEENIAPGRGPLYGCGTSLTGIFLGFKGRL